MRTLSTLLLGALILGAGPVSVATANNDDDLVTESPPLFTSDDVTVELEGRVQVDFTVAKGDGSFRAIDGVDFRRAYIGVKGTVYDWIDYKASYDMAVFGGVLTDVFMRMNGTFVGDYTVGHFKEPFGLEQMTSNKYLTFNERSVSDAFTPKRNTGMMLSGMAVEDNLSWAIGMFRGTNAQGDDNIITLVGSEDAEYAFTARGTGAVWNENDGANVLHLGAAISHRQADDGIEIFATRPEAHQFLPFVNTGILAADSTNLLGLECAWVKDSLSIQGEYTFAAVDGATGSPNTNFSGGYIEGSYFLTGERRVYKKEGGVFGRTKPKKNYHPKTGGGAWMVATRYSMIDLNDGPATDEMNNISFALTRILNPYAKVNLNLIRSYFTDSAPGAADGEATIAVVRFQFDF